MANKKYEEADIQAIAEAIREKTGSEDSYKVSDMASGVNNVYRCAEQEKNLAMWNWFTNYNNRGGCYLFYGLSTVEYIRPPFKLSVKDSSSCDNMFSGCSKLKRIEKDYFDLSTNNRTGNTTQGNGYLCSGCYALEVFEDVNISASSLNSAFNYCSKLHTIELLRSIESTYFNSAFYRCESLQNIAFSKDSVIGKNISFSHSPLTVDSMKNVITALKDYAGTTSEYTYTVTFKTSAFEALEAEGATAEYNGVACTWAELIDNLKWNLVKA